MDLSTEQQIELLGLMKHWAVATQNDKTKDGNYMVVVNDSFEQHSLGNAYHLVEVIENLRGDLFAKDFIEYEKKLTSKLVVGEGQYVKIRQILNMLFDDMVRQVNVRNQRKDSKYKMMYLTFVDFLEKLPKK
jgi:hypothetical protein